MFFLVETLFRNCVRFTALISVKHHLSTIRWKACEKGEKKWIWHNEPLNITWPHNYLHQQYHKWCWWWCWWFALLSYRSFLISFEVDIFMWAMEAMCHNWEILWPNGKLVSSHQLTKKVHIQIGIYVKLILYGIFAEGGVWMMVLRKSMPSLVGQLV